MSIPMIETGYKPQFSLGALYQGFNAGSADNAAQLANLAKEWELQKSRAEDPYKVLSSMYQGNLDNAKMQDPNYIPWQLAGQVGQMQTQEAAGRKAQALSESDIAAAKQENKNKLITGQLDYKTYQEQERMFNDLLNGGGQQQPPGQIGFPMQQQSDRNENYSNEGRGMTPLPILKNEAAMKASMGTDYHSGSKPYDLETIDKEIRQFGDKTGELGKERARIVAELSNGGNITNIPNAGSAPVFSNRMQQPGIGNKPTPYSELIPKQSLLAQMAGIRALDPKFVQDMSKTEQKTDSAEDIAVMRAQQLREAAAARQKITEPKYKEQLAAHQDTMAEYQYKTSQGLPISAEDYKKAYQSNEWLRTHEQMLQIANPANFQPKMDMGAMGVPQRPTPVAQANAARPSLGSPSAGAPTGTTIKYDKQGNRIQ